MVEETVLVTGGCGFIGLRFVAALKEAGHSVRVLDIPRANFSKVESLGAKVFQGSVTDGESVRVAMGNSKVVYHMVAPELVIEDDGFIRRMVVAGAEIVMEEAEDASVEHVLAASTTGVYARASAVMDEKAPLRPGNRLEKAKRDMERSFQRMAERSEIGVTCLRLSNVYGAGDRCIVDRLVPEVVLGNPITIPAKGWVNTVHVEDVVDAGRRLTDQARGDQDVDLFRVFNCTDNTPMSPRKVLDAIASAEGTIAPGIRKPGLVGGSKGRWANRSRSIRFVEQPRYNNTALRQALKDWPAYGSLVDGLAVEIDGNGP